MSQIVRKWREGFHPPAIDAETAFEACLGLDPDGLFEASKAEDHPLHEELWAEGDQVWANRGRRERCRQIISNIVDVIVVGGYTVETRSFETVKINNERSWKTIEEIVEDPKLLEAHRREIIRLQLQAVAKMERLDKISAT